MHVLVTGNTGYVGPAVAGTLREDYAGLSITGYDTGFFAHCLTGAQRLPEARLDRQVFGDVRELDPALLDGVEAVVALAAVSNDPMGDRYQQVTEAVNRDATMNLARAAKARGAKRFVFASSCSIYGLAEGGPRRESDALNPLTAYARSKVDTERELATLADESFTVTCLRFATACGWSERLRLDLVLNDFVAGALATGRIHILSDGSPWRPLIVIDDMARAVSWAVTRDAGNGGHFLAVNTGANRWNYQVRDLAKAVGEVVPDVQIDIDASAQPDKRSYRVDFGLFERLAPAHQPRVELAQAIEILRDGLQGMSFADPNYRDSSLIRMNVLGEHVRTGRLDEKLRWVDRVSGTPDRD